MALPPDHGLPERSDEPLTENVFRVGGYSMAGSEMRVLEVASGERCRLLVRAETTEEVAPHWAERGPPYPPGAVQFRSAMEVWFTPAEPGKEYRLECIAGDLVRRYEGPPVGLDPEMRPTPAELERNQRRRGLVVGVALAVIGGLAATLRYLLG